ncbi:hypothetical protein HNP46_006537 [Pseudomonas nitritireducens]|uniref:Uncharacterized protein n=1 Tax=Pseudomonas nitroreducens TaxID=46680 RepID=A0A7W7P426_PSENT|nr:hypothetical protein [Pseudomonas nitritireducens]MBB4867623.1 hypothetical protein [Pseudomonas nitritireducens]
MSNANDPKLKPVIGGKMADAQGLLAVIRFLQTTDHPDRDDILMAVNVALTSQAWRGIGSSYENMVKKDGGFVRVPSERAYLSECTREIRTMTEDQSFKMGNDTPEAIADAVALSKNSDGPLSEFVYLAHWVRLNNRFNANTSRKEPVSPELAGFVKDSRRPRLENLDVIQAVLCKDNKVDMGLYGKPPAPPKPVEPVTYKPKLKPVIDDNKANPEALLAIVRSLKDTLPAAKELILMGVQVCGYSSRLMGLSDPFLVTARKESIDEIGELQYDSAILDKYTVVTARILEKSEGPIGELKYLAAWWALGVRRFNAESSGLEIPAEIGEFLDKARRPLVSGLDAVLANLKIQGIDTSIPVPAGSEGKIKATAELPSGFGPTPTQANKPWPNLKSKEDQAVRAKNSYASPAVEPSLASAQALLAAARFLIKEDDPQKALGLLGIQLAACSSAWGDTNQPLTTSINKDGAWVTAPSAKAYLDAAIEETTAVIGYMRIQEPPFSELTLDEVLRLSRSYEPIGDLIYLGAWFAKNASTTFSENPGDLVDFHNMLNRPKIRGLEELLPYLQKKGVDATLQVKIAEQEKRVMPTGFDAGPSM